MLRQFKVVSGDELAFRQHYRAADTIDQFPDVPRPAIVMQRCNRVRGKAMYPARTFIFEPFKCVRCKFGDVFSSHAKRWLPNLKHAKPEEKVCPEPAFLHGSLHVLVRCRDHPYIHINGFKTAQAFNLAFLDKTQQGGLTLVRQVANFVEEQRSAMRLFDSPYLALRGTGERSAFVAEQLRMQEIRGNSAAIHRHERPVAAQRSRMNH